MEAELEKIDIKLQKEKVDQDEPNEIKKLKAKLASSQFEAGEMILSLSEDMQQI